MQISAHVREPRIGRSGSNAVAGSKTNSSINQIGLVGTWWRRHISTGLLIHHPGSKDVIAMLNNAACKLAGQGIPGNFLTEAVHQRCIHRHFATREEAQRAISEYIAYRP